MLMVSFANWEAAMSLETEVASHYGAGDLLARIEGALKQAGVDPRQPTIDDLKPVDEFHTGVFDHGQDG